MPINHDQSMPNGYKNIIFQPIVLSNVKAVGTEYLPFVVDLMRGYESFFCHDDFAGLDDPEAWLSDALDFIEEADGWFVVGVVDGVPTGLLWAINWDSHTCEIGGAIKRKQSPDVTRAAVSQFVDLLFAEVSDLKLIRSDPEDRNKAAVKLLTDCGFNTPERRRGARYRNGQPINAIIVSVTRDEWSQLRA